MKKLLMIGIFSILFSCDNNEVTTLNQESEIEAEFQKFSVNAGVISFNREITAPELKIFNEAINAENLEISSELKIEKTTITEKKRFLHIFSAVFGKGK